jgi:soluble lytic murein transglycosylase
LRRASVVLGALALASSACRSGSNVAPPAVTTTPTAEAKVSVKVPGLPALHVVLDDPRIARVRDLERAKDFAGAARLVREAAPADLPAPERCAWDYLEGRLWLAAGTAPDAIASFQRAEDPACPLAAYARLRGAQALARAGRADEAISKARAVPEDLTAARDDVRMVLAESLAAKGDRASALPLWRTWLANNPHGQRWVDTSVRIATALLDGVDGPADAHAREAYDLATKVVVEAPKLADAAGAVAVRARAVAALRAREPQTTDALPDLDRARQAQVWLDLGEPNKAYELAAAVWSTTAKQSPAACRAAVVRANAAVKAKGVKIDGWPDAIAACEKDETFPQALYQGAKAKATKDPKLAIEWFGKIEQQFPAHRLADDARLRAALLVAQSTEEGHEERAEKMLLTLPEAYPSGDMKTEALFRAALAKMQRGHWDAARPLLEKIDEIAPEDRHWATAGRAEYFRARAAAQSGDVDCARAKWARIVERHPLSFYMLLAYARLAESDAAIAARTMKDAAARDADGTFPSKPYAVLESPAVVRAARLLEVGDVEAAKKEIAASGATAESADPEVVWAIGVLYNKAGYPELGHAFSRGRLSDHLAHWPEGRWRVPWEVAYPRAFESVVVKCCTQNVLPTTLAWAIMREESSFVAEARSHSNAIGLMQLIPPTARLVASGTSIPFDDASLKRPEVSVELGTRLLSKLRVTHGHPALAIGAYNAGGGAVERWVSSHQSDDLDLFVELIPYDETRNYVKRVLSSQATYAYLYDPSALKEPLGLPLRLGR